MLTLSRRRAFALSAAALAATGDLPAQQSGRMLVCGGNAVYDARLGGSVQRPVWEDVRAWRPERSKGLPLAYALTPFATTDDCKPIDDGRRMLITSSAGGVAIVDRASHETLFYARAANAHSACMLPGGHVVVAASTHDNGNALLLFHRDKPEQEIFRTALYSAHGVEWDARRELLYAVGMDTLQEYRFDPASREAPLRLAHQTPLPSKSGHELSPAPNDRLFVSTGSQVLLYHKDQRTLEPHPVLGPQRHVKCVALHPQSGRLAYVVPDGGESVWWTFRLRFLNPDAEVESPGQRIYKVRWA